MLEVGGHELICVIGGGVEVGRIWGSLVLIVGIKHDDSYIVAYLDYCLIQIYTGVDFLHLCLPVI